MLQRDCVYKHLLKLFYRKLFLYEMSLHWKAKFNRIFFNPNLIHQNKKRTSLLSPIEANHE